MEFTVNQKARNKASSADAKNRAAYFYVSLSALHKCQVVLHFPVST